MKAAPRGLVAGGSPDDGPSRGSRKRGEGRDPCGACHKSDLLKTELPSGRLALRDRAPASDADDRWLRGAERGAATP